MLTAKKGFSLIELLVVIAIIGILSAVGITAYSGYTADAKEQATRAMHAQLVALSNAEMAKCSQGAGSWVWKVATNETAQSSTAIACTTAVTAAPIISYANATLGMKNPHSVDSQGATGSGTTLGQVVITDSSGTLTFTTLVATGVTITATVAPY
jgi:type IV pilus assembly protein PilA